MICFDDFEISRYIRESPVKMNCLLNVNFSCKANVEKTICEEIDKIRNPKSVCVLLCINRIDEIDHVHLYLTPNRFDKVPLT